MTLIMYDNVIRRRKSQSVFTSINYYLIDRLISFHLTSSGRVAINPSVRITWSSSGSLCSLSKLPFLYSITFIFVLLPFIVSEPILYSNISLPTCFHRPPPRFLSGVRVTRSLVLYVCFVDRCLFFCTFSVGHCVVCSSSIYWFWLFIWYLQTLLKYFSYKYT